MARFGTYGIGAAIATPVLSVLLGIGYILYPDVYPVNCLKAGDEPEDNLPMPDVVLEEGRLPGETFLKAFPWGGDWIWDIPDPFPFIWSQKENPLGG
jgi:hypothetical protein